MPPLLELALLEPPLRADHSSYLRERHDDPDDVGDGLSLVGSGPF
jgi:hypothetical protein